MNERINGLLEKMKSPKVLITVGVAGILLILLSSFLPGGASKERSPSPAENGITAEEYRHMLEDSVKEMVTQLTGSGKVNVVITLESGIRYSYAGTNEGATANKTESDSETTSSELKQSYITVRTADGGEQALLVTEEMPQVRGVAIVCEGGDDAILNEKIKSAVMAALNITSKRVYVAGGNSYEKR